MEEEKIVIDKWFDKKLTISLGRLFIITTLLLLIFFVSKMSFTRSRVAKATKEDGLEIRDLVRKVKMELMAADTDRINRNEHALFKLKDFRMEISFTVRDANKTGTNLDYKFVTIENDAATANEKVQKLMLHWEVIPAKKKRFQPDITSDGMVITEDSVDILK